MMTRSILLFGLALFAGFAASAELTSQKDKLSYALGMGQADTLQQYAIEVNPEVYSQGFRDTLSGGKTLLTEAEARVIQSALQGELKSRQAALARQAMMELAEKNKQEGGAFQAENKSREGVVTLESGLQYTVLKAGDGRKPALNETVVVNYRGTLLNGMEFDSSGKHGQPATFPLNKVIKGWAEALQLMPVGSRWQLVVPPDLAYGERGAGRKIGPNATLVFEVELLAIKDMAAGQSAAGKASAPPDAGAAPAGPDKDASAAAALAGINVSFKLDPRLTRGLYMGERWVSPPTYTNTNSPDGKTLTVEARARGLDGKGQATNISPSWIPADPGMVTVAPGQGSEVKITVQHPGTSKLKVSSAGMSKELLITAKHEGGKPIQVEITQ